MKLEEVTNGASLEGVEPSIVVTVVAAIAIPPDSLQLVYRLPDGALRERLVSRADEASLVVATASRPWSFDGDGAAFQLTAEAKRIDLAYLFDPRMAVHTSNVEPLPHQITAVYESMLPRQPLRFVLADDPGSGKTIMAGLYLRELVMRADARRVLIVAPGSLVEQWRDELFEKFGLEFRVYSKALELASPSGNPFEDVDHLILRLDQMARAKGTSVTGLVEAGVLHSSGGKVRLLRPNEYPEDWDARGDTRLPIWEALHQLIRAMRKDGESGAAYVLAAVRSKGEAIRQLGYRLFTVCERRSLAADARAYNDIVMSWPAIEAAAGEVPDSKKQLAMFGGET